MVVREGEMNWQHGEVESTLQREDEEAIKNDINNVISSSLGRQSSSIYSLTLDEFQHSLCESGKNFGSMNMDEFLSSIWNAEENQQQAASNNNNNSNNFSAIQKCISKQASLPRQNSLSIPAPLCRKTVEQVWSEIHKEQHHNNNNNVAQNTESTPRQPTFGEMTLEDFLVKAGVVREQQSAMQVAAVIPPAVSSHRPQQQHYAAVYPNNNSTMAQAASFAIGGGGGNVNVVAPPYQTVVQGGGAVGEPSGSGYAGNGKRDNIGTGYPPPPPAVCYGGRVVNGGAGGYGVPVAQQTMGMGGPVSPVSSDGIGNDNSGGHFGLDMSGLRGRKRMVDGPVERVVERRQRRMIKNRESAARSRARKQAYTVELEAELNQLREENSQLKQALAELERRRRQQVTIFDKDSVESLEESNVRVQTKAQKAKEKLIGLRRNTSCHM